jgi:hypothetical protein
MPKRNPPAHSVTWMKALAQEKRNKTTEELKHVAAVALKSIKACESLHKKITGKSYYYFPHLEAGLDGLLTSCRELNFTNENFWYCQRVIIHKLYGDPQVMAQSTGLKTHALPYWNPTTHKLNISPMGIVESVDVKTREAKFVEFVAPGAHVWIPEGYTVGGKYSTVFGVAPQLRPLPRQVDRNNLLDLAPLTYTEWCMFTDNTMSECCKDQAVWHEKADCLVCSKCGNKVRGIPG